MTGTAVNPSNEASGVNGSTSATDFDHALIEARRTVEFAVNPLKASIGGVQLPPPFLVNVFPCLMNKCQPFMSFGDAVKIEGRRTRRDQRASQPAAGLC